MEWSYIALTLFLIMDPIGNINAFLSLVKEIPRPRQQFIVAREMLIVLALMIFFNFVGEGLLEVLEISQTTVNITSGILLFMIALYILFPSVTSPRANLPKGEPFIVPLAIPLLCGPALIATIMLFARAEPYISTMIIAILAAWAAAAIILYFGPRIQKVLGNNGLVAAERLMGMVLIILAIQRFLEGVRLFVNTP